MSQLNDVKRNVSNSVTFGAMPILPFRLSTELVHDNTINDIIAFKFCTLWDYWIQFTSKMKSIQFGHSIRFTCTWYSYMPHIVFGPCFGVQNWWSFLVLQSSRWRGEGLTILNFLMLCGWFFSLSLPHGAVGWSAVSDCGVRCSESLIIFFFNKIVGGVAPTRYPLSIHFVIDNAKKLLSSTCEKCNKNNLRPHAYLQTMTKTPVKFRKNRYKTVGGVAPTLL